MTPFSVPDVSSSLFVIGHFLRGGDLSPGERHSRDTRDDGTVTLCSLRAATCTVTRLSRRFWSSLSKEGDVALAWRSRCHGTIADKHCTSHRGVESPPFRYPPLKSPRCQGRECVHALPFRFEVKLFGIPRFPCILPWTPGLANNLRERCRESPYRLSEFIAEIIRK